MSHEYFCMKLFSKFLPEPPKDKVPRARRPRGTYLGFKYLGLRSQKQIFRSASSLHILHSVRLRLCGACRRKSAERSSSSPSSPFCATDAKHERSLTSWGKAQSLLVPHPNVFRCSILIQDMQCDFNEPSSHSWIDEVWFLWFRSTMITQNECH